MNDQPLHQKMQEYLTSNVDITKLEQVLELSTMLNEISVLAEGYRIKLLESAVVNFSGSNWPSYYLAMYYESVGNLEMARQYLSLIDLEEVAADESYPKMILEDLIRLSSSD